MIKTIIFDLGNVIVPFDIETGLDHLAAVCDYSSFEVRKKLVAENHSQDFHEGKITSLQLFENVKESLKLRMSFEEFSDAWNSIFSLEPIIAENLIEQLSKKYRLLILSDTNQLHFDFVKLKFPVLRNFDDFVLSHEVGAVKPSPLMYEAALEKAKCLPEECFFTDDKEENIIGAREFGINSVQFISLEQFENYLIDQDLIKKIATN